MLELETFKQGNPALRFSTVPVVLNILLLAQPHQLTQRNADLGTFGESGHLCQTESNMSWFRKMPGTPRSDVPIMQRREAALILEPTTP